MKEKLFTALYGKFARVTVGQRKTFLYKRLPVYLLAVLILFLFGVKTLIMTFFLALSFGLGWFLKSFISAVKDYRLTLRLNRVHFTHAEYESLQRENRALTEAVLAFQTVRRGAGGAEVARPQAAAPQTVRGFAVEDIKEMVRSFSMEEKA